MNKSLSTVRMLSYPMAVKGFVCLEQKLAIWGSVPPSLLFAERKFFFKDSYPAGDQTWNCCMWVSDCLGATAVGEVECYHVKSNKS